MNGIHAFDDSTGVIEVEGGVLLADLLDVVVPRGWFPPVTPGTQFVTVGGAIANDVHGKNHHRAGTFGRHVTELELLRSDRGLVRCSQKVEADLFAATVGGLGLTGLITRAWIQLAPVRGPQITVERLRFSSLSDFFTLSQESDTTHDYTVAWVDCLARGPSLGRGWLYRGNHSPEPAPHRSRGRSVRIPVTPPFSLIGGLPARVFNSLYYHRRQQQHGVVDYRPFFYPLDRIQQWNRLYGPRGFFQFQCVVPAGDGPDIVKELLTTTSANGLGSFLAVLKVFGPARSPGIMSFPRPGPTLALDFANRGSSTQRLLGRLEEIVRDADGALYPAKDSTMLPSTFEAAFPRWREVEALRDPIFSSSLWRRVTGTP